MTSMRRNDFASTSFRRHVPTRFLINQCQIIIFLILKSDIIKNSRIELRVIVCKYHQIKLRMHLLLFYSSTGNICDFFLFHREIEGKGGWIIGGGQRVCWPLPSQIIGEPAPLAPLPTPMLLCFGLCIIREFCNRHVSPYACHLAHVCEAK